MDIYLHEGQEFVIGEFTQPEAARQHFGGLLVTTNKSVFQSANVAIAYTPIPEAKNSALWRRVSAEVTQRHSSEYGNPDLLPKRGVLVIGSGPSGC